MSAGGRGVGDRREESSAEHCPGDVLGWIPGYVDGVLSEDAHRRVEAHLAVCPECRREVDLVAGMPVELDLELPDPDRVFDEILVRIEALAGDPPPRAEPARIQDDRGRDPRPAFEDWSEQDRARLRDWLMGGEAFEEEADSVSGRAVARFRAAWDRGSWGLGHSWRIAAAILLVMLGGAGGAILSASLLPKPSGDAAEVFYEPATEAGGAASFREGALDVVFRKDATALEIRDALRSLGAEIVAGPSAMGVYRVRVRGPVAVLRAPEADRGDSGSAGAGEPPVEPVVAEAPGVDWRRIVADGLVAPGTGVAVFAEPAP